MTLASLSFCLSIHSLLLIGGSQLTMTYTDDILLGGTAALASIDIFLVKSHGTPSGLVLNKKVRETHISEGHKDEVFL